MLYVKKQTIGILAPVVAVLGLWSLIALGWYERVSAVLGDLVIKLLTAMLNLVSAPVTFRSRVVLDTGPQSRTVATALLSTNQQYPGPVTTIGGTEWTATAAPD